MAAKRYPSLLSVLAGLSLLLITSACEIDLGGMFNSPGSFSSYYPECDAPNICIKEGMSSEDILKIISYSVDGDTIMFLGDSFVFTSGMDLSGKKNLVILGQWTSLKFIIDGGSAINMNDTEGIQIDGLGISGRMNSVFELKNARDNTFSNIYLESGSTGFDISNSENIAFRNTSLYGFQIGIKVENCANVDFSEGSVESSWKGIEIINSSGAVIEASWFYGNSMGLVARNTLNFTRINDIRILSNGFSGIPEPEYTINGPEGEFSMPGTGVLLAGVRGIRMTQNNFESFCQSAIVILNSNILARVSPPAQIGDGYVEKVILTYNTFEEYYECEEFQGMELNETKIETQLHILTDGLFDPSIDVNRSLCMEGADVRFLNLNLGNGQEPSSDASLHACP